MKKIYDLNRQKKSYPLFRTKPVYSQIDTQVIESIKIRFANNQFSKKYDFQKSFSEAPVCVASAENENVNAYIANITKDYVIVEISETADSIPEVYVHLQIISRTDI
jgi:hypothetical protein